MHRNVVLVLASMALLGVSGCPSPQVLGLTPVQRSSGLWTECAQAMERGVSGDPCTFAGSCADGAFGAPSRAAYCRADGELVVATNQRVATGPLERPQVREDGCLEQTTLGATMRSCVGDEMLGVPSDAIVFDMDGADACAALATAPLGGRCRGATTCVVGQVDDIAQSIEGRTPTLRPGVLGWCHQGRLRTAPVVVTMPCVPIESGGIVSCAW
ncbi:MAG: hypothetical protein U0234_30090 [Sandaracinus sp.]